MVLELHPVSLLDGVQTWAFELRRLLHNHHSLLPLTLEPHSDTTDYTRISSAQRQLAYFTHFRKLLNHKMNFDKINPQTDIIIENKQLSSHCFV